jgi:uncharacterized protein
MKLFLSTLSTVAVIYLLFSLMLYLLQERFIFFPQQLPQDYHFRFSTPFEERYIPTAEGVQLHGLLFKADTAVAAREAAAPRKQSDHGPDPYGRRLVFFLHGNAGAVNSWGEVAPTYTQLGYDVFVLDYRGYGKSGGRPRGEEQFFADVEAAYLQLLQEYEEQQVVVLGISLGSGPAAWLASRHQPAMLLLLTPYYSLTDMMRRTMPLVPTFLLKYPFRTHDYLPQVSAPVYLIHGTRDEVIPFDSSLKLQPFLKPGDRLIPIEGEYHNSLHGSPRYQALLPELLP